MKEDIDSLQQRVSSIESAVQQLQSSYQKGKIISSVSPLSPAVSGWIITFSDNSQISIHNGEDGKDGTNGKDGISPILKIDNQGFWSQSLDGGTSFSFITNVDGKPQRAMGDNGINVNVVETADGYYGFETYQVLSPDGERVVVDTIATPFPTDKSRILSSITRNELSHTLTITMASGEEFCFALKQTYATGIVVLTDRVVLNSGGESTFEFRLNPSNASFNPSTESEDQQCFIDVVNTMLTRSVRVNAPKHYKLQRIVPSIDEQGNPIEGQYSVTILDLGTATDYTDGVVLTLLTEDSEGNAITLSSQMFRICWDEEPAPLSFTMPQSVHTTINGNNIVVQLPFGTDVKALPASFAGNFVKAFVGEKEQISGKTTNDFSLPQTYRFVAQNGVETEYKVMVCFSQLPIVYIQTPNATPIVSKDNWIEESTILIANTTDGEFDAELTKVSIKGRGNSTWGYPKKPYAIKLNKKAEVLGMPKHKRWCLLANWMDRTMMRNAVAFEVARSTEDLGWTPRGRFVDVVLNGKYIGNYYLCEQIKIDENRVDIAEMDINDTEPEKLSGGYIFELDTYYDEVNKFRSQYRNLPVMIKEPDEETVGSAHLAWIQNYFNEAEGSLYASETVSENYTDYIDIASFVDWWFVYELVGNREPSHPKSCYMHKDRNGKLVAGPVWDFDWGTFTPRTAFAIKNTIWYSKLFTDPTFVALVKEKWAREKPSFEAIATFIDDTEKQLKTSDIANSALWPISSRNTNGDEALSYADAVARMRKAYLDRIAWLDSQISGL